MLVRKVCNKLFETMEEQLGISLDDANERCYVLLEPNRNDARKRLRLSGVLKAVALANEKITKLLHGNDLASRSLKRSRSAETLEADIPMGGTGQ